MKRLAPRRQPRLFGRTLILLSLLAIVGLTAFAAIAAQRSVQQRSIDLFNQDTKAANDHFVKSMQHYGDLLYQSRSYIHGSQTVSQQEWQKYFGDQDVFGRYEGVSGLFFAEKVSRAEKPAFLARMRAQPELGGANYDINPAGDRNSYILTTLYVSANPATNLGFDLYSTAVRQQVYDSALTRNTPTTSPPLKLGSGKLGFFMVMPVFADGSPSKLLGYAGVSFRSDQLFKTLYEQNTPRGLDVRIVSSDELDKAVELYRSSGWQSDSSAKLVRSDTFNIAGRRWTTYYQAGSDYDRDTNGRYLPWAVTLAGSLLAIVLAIAYSIIFRDDEPTV